MTKILNSQSAIHYYILKGKEDFFQGSYESLLFTVPCIAVQWHAVAQCRSCTGMLYLNRFGITSRSAISCPDLDLKTYSSPSNRMYRMIKDICVGHV